MRYSTAPDNAPVTPTTAVTSPALKSPRSTLTWPRPTSPPSSCSSTPLAANTNGWATSARISDYRHATRAAEGALPGAFGNLQHPGGLSRRGANRERWRCAGAGHRETGIGRQYRHQESVHGHGLCARQERVGHTGITRHGHRSRVGLRRRRARQWRRVRRRRRPGLQRSGAPVDVWRAVLERGLAADVQANLAPQGLAYLLRLRAFGRHG